MTTTKWKSPFLQRSFAWCIVTWRASKSNFSGSSIQYFKLRALSVYLLPLLQRSIHLTSQVLILTVKEYKLNYWHLDSRTNTVWSLWSDNKGCSVLVYVYMYLQRPLAIRGAILAIAAHCQALSVRRLIQVTLLQVCLCAVKDDRPGLFTLDLSVG